MGDCDVIRDNQNAMYSPNFNCTGIIQMFLPITPIIFGYNNFYIKFIS